MTDELSPLGAPELVREQERIGMFGATGTGDTSGYGGLVRPAVVAPSTPRPYGGWFDAAVDAIAIAYPAFEEAIERIVVAQDELTLYLRREHLLGVAQVLRDDPATRFELLTCVSGVDWIDQTDGRRLHAVYHLLSLSFRRRIRLEVQVTVDEPSIPSLTGLYPTANFHERETFDFFGIVFDGHPNLVRILMPDEWEGHPQRKDYPLGGIPVEYKGAEIPPPNERRSYA